MNYTFRILHIFSCVQLFLFWNLSIHVLLGEEEAQYITQRHVLTINKHGM